MDWVEFMEKLSVEREKFLGHKPVLKKHLLLTDMSPVILPAHQLAYIIESAYNTWDISYMPDSDNNQNFHLISLPKKFEAYLYDELVQIVLTGVANYASELVVYDPEASLAKDVFMVKYLIGDKKDYRDEYNNLWHKTEKIAAEIGDIRLWPVVMQFEPSVLQRTAGDGLNIVNMGIGK